MDMRDVKVDTFTNSGPKITMTLTHIPTDLCVSGDGDSRFHLGCKLISLLEEKVRIGSDKV